MKTTIQQFLKQEDGVAAIEYGLLAGLLACAIITAVGLVGTDLAAMFNAVAGRLVSATPAAAA
ncbi:pilus assembly protein Flp/PilA [Pararobbsia alpina]|uniref:Flp family type IVb pilin n=1 Tax=Pararobbsia alpina TaxID=621374 RepID=UPI0039A51302